MTRESQLMVVKQTPAAELCDGQNGTQRNAESTTSTATTSYDQSLKLIDLKELARWLSISQRSVYRLVAQGLLEPPVKVGRASRWLVGDVIQYMTRLQSDRRKHNPILN